MNYEGSGATDERSTLVVSDALAARQWELELAREEIGRALPAWPTPTVIPYWGWLETLWLDGPGERAMPLTPGQSRALWRRVIGESPESADLIGQAGVAEWAAAAWELLHRWRIDPGRERAGAGQVDYRALLGWCSSYRQALDDCGWLDRAELEGRLAAAPPRSAPPATLADFAESWPARDLLLERLGAAGQRLGVASGPTVEGRRRAVRLADAVDELRVALAWARARLEHAPNERIAIVVAGLAGRQAELERVTAATFAAARSSPVWNGGQPLAADAAIGAACNALALLAPGAGYAVFGRWLRSRYFAGPAGELARRGQLDAELRTSLRSQLPFMAAYRQCGLKELLEQRLPASADALERALQTVGTARRATPSRWAHTWTRFLTALGWQPPPPGPRLIGWQACLDEFARLTPVLGELSIDSALAELERVLASPAPAPLPIHGVHVLSRIEQVGVGYDAAWVTGFTDAFWPEAPGGNPLLPRSLQREHAMPWATPQDARDRSARALARLVQRTPELVVSWPARVYDYETEPSPSLRGWQTLTPEELAGFALAAPRQTRTRHTVDDPAPAVTGAALPGGVGMLNRQARCPLVAFCRDRLGAAPLEPLAFGLPGRLRGIAVHRALEALLEPLPNQTEIARIDEQRLHQAAERALATVFARTRRPLRVLFDLETEQLCAVLRGWLDAEQHRTPFQVVAVEQRREVTLGGRTLRVRLDRLDRLADGTVAIIDYKTGERASSAEWFAPRLRDTQVPLYAIDLPQPIGAAVLARVRPNGTSYHGAWSDGAFPGRTTRASTGDWSTQRQLWRSQLELLVREFTAGDTRVFPADVEDAGGAYAPLTRLAELLALARGTISTW